jgi:glutathione S-transferase
MTDPRLDQPILHHFDMSPFSEKIRLIFGRKGVAWRSVVIPMVMPKPDLVALTGGYRRTPVMQIGAEIFCDTLLIADEIERRWPEPTLYPDGRAGHHKALAFWAETNLFWPAARLAVGVNAEHLPQEFHDDRAAMFGLRPPTPELLAKSAERAKEQVLPQVEWVARMLEGANADEGGYLLGDTPGLADIAVYHCLWFLDVLPKKLLGEVTDSAAVRDWMARIAEIGHAERSELSAEAAIAEAAAGGNALPADEPIEDASFVAGQAVTVSSVDRASPPVTGGLALLTSAQVAVRRRDDRAGEVIVHFPRLGYRVSAA